MEMLPLEAPGQVALDKILLIIRGLTLTDTLKVLVA
jgi:hypothetical protein